MLDAGIEIFGKSTPLNFVFEKKRMTVDHHYRMHGDMNNECIQLNWWPV